MPTETDIARPVVDWLNQEGWEVFQEVEYEGRIADIVATRGPVTHVVEVKRSRCLEVLDQALAWIHDADRVSVAVPMRRFGLRSKAWDFVCQRAGLGEFIVDRHDQVEIARSPLRQVAAIGLRSALREEHKHFAEAGNDKGKRWTPFGALVQRLVVVVEEHPGIKLTEFVEITNHHCGTDQAAVRTLRRVIKNGGVKGIEVRHGGRCYPEGYNHHSMKAEA